MLVGSWGVVAVDKRRVSAATLNGPQASVLLRRPTPDRGHAAIEPRKHHRLCADAIDEERHGQLVSLHLGVVFVRLEDHN